MESIFVHDATEHNLKHVTVRFPLRGLTCVFGPSGCGKSSLVFDTLYAESQRNLLEGIAGGQLWQRVLDKPKVDSIENLRPALNLSQVCYNTNPRSTIGSVSDISYYLRTLFAFEIGLQRGVCLEMNQFSPNNPDAWCPHCTGLGEEWKISEEALIPDERKSIGNGGILYYKGGSSSYEHKLLEAICSAHGIDLEKPVQSLTNQERYILLFRTTSETYHIRYKTVNGRYKTATVATRGAIVELQEKLARITVPSVYLNISKYLVRQKCSVCHGQKLNPTISALTLGGLGIGAVEQLSFDMLVAWINSIRKTRCVEASEHLLNEILRRVQSLQSLKLGHLCLGRAITTLSGGELQRLRLATQMNCGLTGMLYILDEPSRGLHEKDLVSVAQALKYLIARGNTIIAIEHNPRFLQMADYLIEMGPGGGPSGGTVLFEGTRNIDVHIPTTPFKQVRSYNRQIQFHGINYHNIKGLDVNLPLGVISCISGVSGSGKSSLGKVIELCCSRSAARFCKSVTGFSFIKHVEYVSQKPIGKTARSTIISYLGIADIIRDCFASTESAKILGFSQKDFSLNTVGGRCERCQGTGRQKIELAYLPESSVLCPDCKGRRFHDNILTIRYKGFSIGEILDANISDLLPIFQDVPAISATLACLEEIGLGYLSLGRMSMTLSGGEAQRIKLVKCLSKKVRSDSLYILDEPTLGLSEADISRIQIIIERLAEQGATVVVIEHNRDFIKRSADYLIDLGQIPGEAGGTTLIQGNPIHVMNDIRSSWSSKD